MREIKINDSMEIHYTTKLEDYSFSHGLGVERRVMEDVDQISLVVKTAKGDWVDITHALTDDMRIWCENEAEKDLIKHLQGAA